MDELTPKARKWLEDLRANCKAIDEELASYDEENNEDEDDYDEEEDEF